MPLEMSPQRDQSAKVKGPSPGLLLALGQASPELAWLELQDQVALAIEDHYQEAAKLALEQGWEDPLGDLLALLSEHFGKNPEWFLERFRESNPEFKLRQIEKQPPLAVLKATFQTLLLNERLQV